MQEFDVTNLDKEDEALLKEGEWALLDRAVVRNGRVLLLCCRIRLPIIYAKHIGGTALQYNHTSRKWEALASPIEKVKSLGF